MALGSSYDERDPRITEERLTMMSDAKIDFTCRQVQWSHAQAAPHRLPPWIVKLESPMTMSHCMEAHPETSPILHCASNWDVMSTAVERESYWDALTEHGYNADDLVDSWSKYAKHVARWMRRANYLRINDAPVLFHGAPEGMQFYAGRFGVTPSKIDEIIRESIRTENGVDIYRVATSVADSARERLAEFGFDAMTEYLLHGMESSFTSMRAMYRHYWDVDIELCRRQNIDYIVPASGGYDSRAWGSPVKDIAVPTAEEFTEHLREARAFARENYKRTHGIVITYAWNEIGEGGIIEPMQARQLHDGDEMIRAHALAVTTS
jgi:hypothetical protein